MTTTQTILGLLLVAVLFGLAGFYAWRQVRLLRLLRAGPTLPPDEERYLRHQAWRRLINSGLMLVLGILLAVALASLEGPAQRLADQGPAVPATPEQRQFFHLYSLYWIVFLLVLLGVVVLAGVDLWAIRRFGVRQYRQLQADRRALLERQAALARQQQLERN